MIVPMAASVLLSVLGIQDPVVSEPFADLFEAREYQHPDGPNEQPIAIPYRLFVPRNIKANERCPVLLWLHGRNDGGPENHFNMKYLPLVLDDLSHIEQYRFFILVPQCPTTELVWTSPLGRPSSNANEPNDMLTVTFKLLQQMMHDYPIDADRIYMLGICSGGHGTWEMAIRHPGLFAAIVPTAPGGGDVLQAAKLAKIPIWAFHNRNDKPEGTMQMVSAVKKAGGNVYLTLPESDKHDCWVAAFQQCHIMEWMLAQHRGAFLRWMPAGCVPWNWSHILTVPSVCLLVVWLGWFSEQKRRQRKRRSIRVDQETTITGNAQAFSSQFPNS